MKCKYCGKDGIKNKKGLASHRAFNRDCYNEWKKEQNEIEKIKPHVVCQICGKELRNISNTHLKKHSITMKQYKQLFPSKKLFPDELLIEQCKKRESTIKERYTKDEIKDLKGKKSWDSKIKKRNLKTRKEVAKEIYEESYAKNPEKYRKAVESGVNKRKELYEELKKDKKKYKSHKNDRLEKRKKTNLEKYGVEFPQSLDSIKKKQKETLKNNYGSLKRAYSEMSKKCMETRKEKYGKYFLITPLFSLDSQELFGVLESELLGIKCFYATNGNESISNEYQVKVKSNLVYHRNLDFYIPTLNKWIEFDEKYHNYDKQKELDRKRELEIFNALEGIQLLRVNQEYYLDNKEVIFKKCIKFILS